MTDKQKETNELIFEAASRVFQRKGYTGARMQEIADEADINISMLHYYYRSKEKLFQKVYQEQMGRFFPVVFELLASDLPLPEKVRQLVDTWYSFFEKNPKLIPFIIHEMNQNPERFRAFVDEQDIHTPSTYHDRVERGIEEGIMDDIDSEQLIVSIVSLTLFPFLASTMVKAVSNFDDEQFEQFMQERKEFLYKFILNGINYKEQ